jgi:drug/metabolite transporter (DMT)-like permease
VSDLPPPRQPYRASALFHGFLAVVILLFAAITGGDAGSALAIAAGYFVVATGWSWFRFRQREAHPAAQKESRTGKGGES